MDTSTVSLYKPPKLNWFQRVRRHFRKYGILHLMALPVVIMMLLFKYAPMFGIILAFENFNYSKGFFHSDFVGLKNFEFLFTTTDAWTITRNTVVYNVIFLTLDTVLAMTTAILLNDIYSRKLAKVLQTIFMMPYFLSYAVVAIIVYAFLARTGFVNHVRGLMGLSNTVNWYTTRSIWPPLLIFVDAWKSVGYNAVVYMAALSGISHEYYEAAMLDGATKWQQTRYITLPELKSMMIILLIMSLGSIFHGDFGLFYEVTQNNGMLYPVTDVIDTYIYRALTVLQNTGMSTAAGLYQSVVGFAMVMLSNWVVNRVDPDSALF